MCQSEVKTPFSTRHCSWPVDMTQSRWSTADRLCRVPAVPSRCFCGEGGKREVFFVLSASGRSIEVVKNIGSVGCEGGEWRVCSTVISPRAEISEQYLIGYRLCNT